VSVSIANVVTLPSKINLFNKFINMCHSICIVEVLKVRLQLANAAVTTSKSTLRAGLIETTGKIYRKEGIHAFYSGLMPAVIRGLFYGGVRLGIFI
jgi:hypothetical protein